jgi:hypothetical protein
MILIKTKGDFEPISGNPTLTSLDGERRTPLTVIMHKSWSEADREAFGIYVVEDPEVPDGKAPVGPARTEIVKGKPVRVRDMIDATPAPVLTVEEKAEKLAARFGLTLDELRSVLVKV